MIMDEKTRKLVIDHNISKSYNAIADAEYLLERKSFHGALNRIYYGIFFIISALAVKHKYKTSKHSQLIGWFNKKYVRNEIIDRKIGKFIHTAFEQRLDSDYNPLSKFSYQEVADDIIRIKETIEVIERVIKADEEST